LIPTVEATTALSQRKRKAKDSEVANPGQNQQLPDASRARASAEAGHVFHRDRRPALILDRAPRRLLRDKT